MVVYVAELTGSLSRIPPAWRRLVPQFLRFGVVGVAGFAVDTVVVYALRGLIGIYAAGTVSFLVAASGNWVLNRIWVFKGHGSGSAVKQWLLFLSANSFGFVLNRGTFFTLVTLWPRANHQPVIAIFAGTLAGMFANFTLSHRLVFRAHLPKQP